MRLVLAVALAASLAVPVSATTVTVERGGTPVEAEVCRFRAEDSENPFKRWLASQDVVCSGGPSIAFPRGRWNVFARTGDGISLVTLVDGDNAPERLTLTLRAAMSITPILPPATTAVVYAPRLGNAWPLPTVVPEKEPLWLFVLEKGKLAAVVPIVEPRVDARNGGPSAVIGWLEMPARDRAVLQTVSGIATPSVSLGQTRADALPALELLHGAFFRIAKPPTGTGEIRVEGRGWVSHRRPVRIDSPLTVVPDPLPLLASATLVVHWSTSADLVALDRSLGSCKEEEREPEVELTVSACAAPERPADAPDPASCSAIRQELFAPEEKFGVVTIDDLVPGMYRAEMRFGRLPPVSAYRTVRPLQVEQLTVHAMYVEVYGSLTKGGEELGEDATLAFPSGTGFADASSTEYHAIVRMQPIDKDAAVTVVACDGSPRVIVLTDQPIVSGGRYDIDIPDNELAITVSDTFTREMLAGAVGKMEIMSLSMPRRVVLTKTFTTDEEGRVIAKSIPERELRLTVSRSGYQRKIVPPFSLTKNEKRELDVELVPLRGAHARVVSARPFEGAMAYWYSPAGRQTEQADIGPDGTFVYSGDHGPEETLTIVSASHPLWVMQSPRTSHRDTLTLPFPDAVPAASFEVMTAETDRRVSRFVTVAVGGVRVPLPLVRQHQQMRKQSWTISGGGPLKLVDILATGPIDVLLGPTTEEIGTTAATMDLFALQNLADAPKERLAPGKSAVVFPARKP
jgi:hypothetical protein